jgi:hypothetical protein
MGGIGPIGFTEPTLVEAAAGDAGGIGVEAREAALAAREGALLVGAGDG